MAHRHVLPLVALLTLASATLPAQSALRPMPSSRATSEVSLSVPQPASAATAPGMAPAAAPARPLIVRVTYGQPHLRGRVLHTDSLVPYDRPWRLGANATTRFTTEVDLVVGGAPIAAGEYVLYTIPGRSGWKLVIQRSVNQNPGEYADKDDVARIDLRLTTLSQPVESFTMWLVPVPDASAGRGELRFAWGSDLLSTPWSVR